LSTTSKAPASGAAASGATAQRAGSSASGASITVPIPTPAPAPQRKPKLSYKEQRELDGIQPAIEQAEAELHEIESHMSDPDVLSDHKKMAGLGSTMADLQARIAALYARWEELEAKR
jgi:ATP-binding cassette subfamily F protein uup